MYSLLLFWGVFVKIYQHLYAIYVPFIVKNVGKLKKCLKRKKTRQELKKMQKKRSMSPTSKIVYYLCQTFTASIYTSTSMIQLTLSEHFNLISTWFHMFNSRCKLQWSQQFYFVIALQKMLCLLLIFVIKTSLLRSWREFDKRRVR